MAFDVNTLYPGTKALTNDINALYTNFAGDQSNWDQLLSGSIGNLNNTISNLGSSISGLSGPISNLSGPAGMYQSLFNQIASMGGSNWGPSQNLATSATQPTIGVGANGAYLDPTQTSMSTATGAQGLRGDIASNAIGNQLQLASLLPGITNQNSTLLNNVVSQNLNQGSLFNTLGALSNTSGGLFNQLGSLNNQFGGQNVQLGGFQNQVGSLNNYIGQLNNMALEGQLQSQSGGGGLFQNLFGF
jgi:hypothetical protein